jgi:transposase-like protein
MASSNRGGNRGGNRRGNRGRNNNPEGHNQYSGLTARARENPIAAAAAVGGAVAAGVFLWSRRNQISDQIGNLSDQISEWRDGWQSGDEFGSADDTTEETSFIASPRRKGSRKSQSDIAEEAMTLKETGKATA